MRNAVTQVPAALPESALAHFESQFRFETDCWDTHDALQSPDPGFVLIDARSPAAYARGHVPGAINIPVQELDRRLAEVGPADHELIVYCRSGHRSARATEILRQHGFTKVHNLGPRTAW